jgi:hypothetical protein
VRITLPAHLSYYAGLYDASYSNPSKFAYWGVDDNDNRLSSDDDHWYLTNEDYFVMAYASVTGEDAPVMPDTSTQWCTKRPSVTTSSRGGEEATTTYEIKRYDFKQLSGSDRAQYFDCDTPEAHVQCSSGYEHLYNAKDYMELATLMVIACMVLITLLELMLVPLFLTKPVSEVKQYVSRFLKLQDKSVNTLGE